MKKIIFLFACLLCTLSVSANEVEQFQKEQTIITSEVSVIDYEMYSVANSGIIKLIFSAFTKVGYYLHNTLHDETNEEAALPTT